MLVFCGVCSLEAVAPAVSPKGLGGLTCEVIESVVLLQTIGGDSPEDLRLIAQGPCLERGLGYQPPRARAVRGFSGALSR